MNLDISKLITASELLEQSQGNWEGLDRKSPHILEAIKKMQRLQIEYCAPEGESLRMVQKRAIAYLELYIEQAKQQSIIENREISIVIFTHGGLIQSVLQYYLQSNPRDAWLIQQYNTAINEIILNENGVSLVKVNDYGHMTFLIPELETASS
jgi:broad specificity phosphatase PhoE